MQNLKKARFMLSTIESFKNKVRTRYDFAVAKLVILRVRARARPKPAGLGIRKPDGLLRDFAVAKLVIYVCALAHGLSLPA